MSNLNQELIFIAVSMVIIALVFLVCVLILAGRNDHLRNIIREKNKRIEDFKQLASDNWRACVRQQKEIESYKVVMAISDDISAEMQKENILLEKQVKSQELEIRQLKAKLNKKKVPQC